MSSILSKNYWTLLIDKFLCRGVFFRIIRLLVSEMDLVPDGVLSSHLLPLLSFSDAFRLYSSCLRFRRLLSDRMISRLDALCGGPEAAVREGFLDLVEFLVDERGFCDWDEGMCWAAEVGRPDLVGYFVEKGASNWNWGMTSAVFGGHRDIVEYFVEKGASNWNWGMLCAVRGGFRDLVEYFDGRGALFWGGEMSCAAEGGHWDLVEYFVRKGASDWNVGMAKAASGGHLDLVEYFVGRGASDLDWGMAVAVRGGHSDVVEYFEQKLLDVADR